MTGRSAGRAQAAPEWWRRPGLESRDGRLTIVGEDAEALARLHGTPLFVYDRQRYAENARSLQDAAARAGIPFRLRFALKANPLPEVLEVFRGVGSPGSPDAVGIDACSPGEVLRALECGWHPDEISYTGTNVSERDLDVLLAHDIHVNLDAISQVRRYGRRAPGRTIGLRIDPGAGAGYRAHLSARPLVRGSRFEAMPLGRSARATGGRCRGCRGRRPSRPSPNPIATSMPLTESSTASSNSS